MRERRINEAYNASWIGFVASSQKELYVLTTEYISSRQHIVDVVNVPGSIKYWLRKSAPSTLAKETGISHTTLWWLKKGKAESPELKQSPL